MKNYKLIRSMIDEAFSGMPMTAENLALRDEMLANAQDRYEDAIAAGKSESAAAADVMASLGDVRGLLEQMNAQKTGSDAEPAGAQPDAAPDAPKAAPQNDLGDALGKAFGALGDIGRAVVPQTKKFMRDVDKATGGALGDIGRAVNKGMRDAQKAAGEVIDKMSGDAGELVFDFGGSRKEAQPAARTPQELRDEAADLRAQAEIKQAVDDQEGARQLRAKAYALETQADAMEQAEAMRAAQAQAEHESAQEAARRTAETLEDAINGMESGMPDAGDAFTGAVDDITRDAEDAASDAQYTKTDAPFTGSQSFSPAGLHDIDIQCDAVNVNLVPSETGMIDVTWSVREAAPVIRMEGHKLIVRRRSADAISSLFSIFQRDGGEITVCVPRGYGVSCKAGTRSGAIQLRGIDCDDIKFNSTSGSIHIEPDARVRAGTIDASTVSGCITVSACAEDINTQTVSGSTFISCDAIDIEADTVSGNVHVEGACDSCDVDGVSADVELLFTVVPGKKVEINTVSGSARVALPGDIRGFVAELHGMMGANENAIINEFGPNRYGTCALPIKMDTLSGKLMITRL